MGFSYDPLDRVRTMTYPDGETITYNYNDQGLLESMAGQEAYVGNLDYNALGQTTLLQLGNGLATTYDYHEANFRLESVVTTGGLQNLSYTYDDVGNVQTMADAVGGLDLTYTYDELDRLTGVSGSYGRSYAYDSIGNLTDKNGLTLEYNDSNHAHAMSGTSEGWELDYSPTGNLITKTVGSQVVTFGYDAENRLTEVISGTVTTFVYDGDGRRVKKVDESGTTVYIGEHYEAHSYPSWGADIEVVESGVKPAIAADGAGNVYVTRADWYYDNDIGWYQGNIFLARSTDKRESWSEGGRINDTEGDVCYWTEHDIAADEEGNLYVVWIDCRDDTLDIYFRRSTDGGVNWGAASRVSDDQGILYQYDPAVAVDNAGRVYVVWTDWRNGNYDIYFSHSTDGGQTWSTNVRVNDDGGSETQLDPDVAVDAAGNAYAVWEDMRSGVPGGYDVYFARRDANGLWGQNVRINNDAGSAGQYDPSVDVDEMGRVHIVWTDYRSGNEIYSVRSPDGGESWDAELIVSDNAAKSNFWPSVAVEEDGDAYAIWMDDAPGEYDIVSARLNVGELAWQPLGRVNSLQRNASGDNRPVMAVDGKGNVYATWVGSWAEGIYFSRLSDSFTKHYYANGQRVATRVDGALYYVHSDLPSASFRAGLGSTVALSDAAGGEVGRVQYDPYGEVITSTLPGTLTDRFFTGQRFDSSTGLYYYSARYYDPHLGRFIQPDTLVPDPLNPQAWNRFSYVYNNPATFNDPSGHGIWIPLLLGGAFLLGAGMGGCYAYHQGYGFESWQLYAYAGMGGLAGVAGAATGMWIEAALLPVGATVGQAIAAGAVSGFAAGVVEQSILEAGGYAILGMEVSGEMR